MLVVPKLTNEQLQAAEHVGSVYIRACPGAGKTRTLVARATKFAAELPPARGIALLSFTNSAAEEFRERLLHAGASALLSPPHFVGTIDSFMARYIVLPRGNPFAPGRPIQQLDSWKRFNLTIRMGNSKNDWRSVSLAVFPVGDIDVPGRTPTVKFDAQLVARHHGAGLAGQLKNMPQERKAAAEQQAQKRITGLMSRGLLTPAEVRLLGIGFLMASDASAQAHRQNIVARFPRIVIDEAQDCDESIVKIMGQLEKDGSEITLIGDPDQCIYTWRGARPEQLLELSEKWGDQPSITGNFRCSPNICKAACSLKHVPAVDESKGSTADCGWPCYVAPLKSSKPFLVGQRFLALLKEREIDVTRAIVLAPTWSLAMAAAGAEGTKGSGMRLGGRLREACHVARERPDTEAVRLVRDLVLDHVKKRLSWDDEASPDRETAMRIEGEVRRLACELLTADPFAKDWHARALAILDTLTLAPSQTLKEAKSCLPKPTKPLEANLVMSTGLAYSTVHAAKGREYDAVLFVAGDRDDQKFHDLLDDWENRSPGSERRAVAYVAVTRAERLLVVAGPEPHCDRIRALLNRDGAAVELLA